MFNLNGACKQFSLWFSFLFGSNILVGLIYLAIVRANIIMTDNLTLLNTLYKHLKLNFEVNILFYIDYLFFQDCL
jgi:hypothetical protein